MKKYKILDEDYDINTEIHLPEAEYEYTGLEYNEKNKTIMRNR